MGNTARLAALVAAATLITGCATSTSSSSGSGSDGVTSGSIKIGGLLTKTSPVGYTLGDAELGAKARFARANASGGVNGRKINFIGAEDDGMDPSKGDAAARKLVEKDQVFALVPVDAPEFGAQQYLQKQKVPFFGWAVGPQWCATTYGFGYNGCLAPAKGAQTQTWWGRLVAKQLGGAAGKNAWLQGTDDAASQYGVTTIGLSFKAAGFALDGQDKSIPATSAVTDWSPYVNKIMKAKPDVVVSIMTTGPTTGLWGALRKAGYKGALTDAVSYDGTLLKNAQAKQALQGVLAAPQLEPFESNMPQVKQMKTDVNTAAGHQVQLTQAMAVGYWSADLFLAMAQKAGKDLTRASFMAAAGSFTYTNPAVGTVTFPQDHTQPAGCGALVSVNGDGFTVAQHLQCFPDTPFQ
jgi:branched-chain amino acid transport system substrate-binding protein